MTGFGAVFANRRQFAACFLHSFGSPGTIRAPSVADGGQRGKRAKDLCQGDTIGTCLKRWRGVGFAPAAHTGAFAVAKIQARLFETQYQPKTVKEVVPTYIGTRAPGSVFRDR